MQPFRSQAPDLIGPVPADSRSMESEVGGQFAHTPATKRKRQRAQSRSGSAEDHAKKLSPSRHTVPSSYHSTHFA